ncbi:hypothetical protein INT48_008858 [Thamnidium elegans]|uniref:Arf-GAP domain-containing protein n=1 Tax=Thamnidium elegans TaxID=101142 RepID=A0A8H7VVZ4_9FUNG|nr:hypothetical protein INT48_008858 [Thamnidium elegans]
MSLFLAKKQEDLNQKKVRDLLRLKANKKCFDCPIKSPFFVNTTLQTFICARFGHRVKAISASKFSGAELLALKQGGNGVALKIWLSNYSTHDSPEPESDDDVRAFMRQKYFENKWLDRALLQSHKDKVRSLLAKQFTEDGLPIVTKSRTKIVSESSCISVSIPPAPVNTASEYNSPRAFALPPPTSPIGRASTESSHSSFSAKSFVSAKSQPQEDYVSSKRRSMNSNRSSTDSARSSTSTPATSCGASILTAEEIAERCRSSIESKDFVAEEILPQTEEAVQAEQVAPPVVEEVPVPIKEVEQKAVPSLKINVVQANKSFVQFQQREQNRQLKSPTLVNFGNSIQSPSPIRGNASASASPVVTPSTSKAIATPNSFDSIIMELSGLKLEKTIRKATYAGGMLSPAPLLSPLSPSNSTNALKKDDEKKSRSTPMFDPSVFSQFHASTKAVDDNDPYAALRGIPPPVAAIVKEEPKPEPKPEAKELDFTQSDEDDDDPWQGNLLYNIQTPPAQVIQPIIEKPMFAMDIFGDLDPRAMFKRF